MMEHRLASRLGIAKSELSYLLRRKPIPSLARGDYIEEPSTYPVRPAMYDPAQLDRVVACGFNMPMEKQLQVLNETSAMSRPPARLTLQDVTVTGGRLYTKGEIHRLTDKRQKIDLFRDMPRFDEAVTTSSALGLRYFGHWLRDDCAARELLPDDTPPILSFKRPDWNDCAFYEECFAQTWEDLECFHARQLTVLTDIGFSLSKRDRITRLRTRLRESGTVTPSGHDVVYIRRMGGAMRSMVREDALIARLEAAGVAIVETETTGSRVPRAVHGARIVISIEGSQISHAVYNLADKGGILVLQPPARFYNPHHEWARLMEQRYSFVVGQAEDTAYAVDADEVLSMLERLDTAIG